MPLQVNKELPGKKSLKQIDQLEVNRTKVCKTLSVCVTPHTALLSLDRSNCTVIDRTDCRFCESVSGFQRYNGKYAFVVVLNSCSVGFVH